MYIYIYNIGIYELLIAILTQPDPWLIFVRHRSEAGQVELREAQASLKDEERAQKMYQEVAGLPGSPKKRWYKSLDWFVGENLHRKPMFFTI